MSVYQSENSQRMLRGDVYTAFTPELIALRSRTAKAINAFNDSRDVTRRTRVLLWRDITQDTRPMPPLLADPVADEEQFSKTDAWIEPPVHMDYGTQVKVGLGTFINFNSTFVDTCPIVFGERCLVGPNCSFYSGTHPLDPAVRNGLQGPESGAQITIEDDVWIAGNVTVLCGVTIGRGSTIGANSVVTKSVPPFHLAAGNPARVIKKIETSMDPDFKGVAPEYNKGPGLR